MQDYKKLVSIDVSVICHKTARMTSDYHGINLQSAYSVYLDVCFIDRLRRRELSALIIVWNQL